MNKFLQGLDAEQIWDTDLAYARLKQAGLADTKRTAERRLQALGLLPEELTERHLLDELDRCPNRLVLDWAIKQARKRRSRVLFAQLTQLPSGKPCLHANDARGARFWVPLANTDAATILQAVLNLQQHIGKPIAIFPHGTLVGHLRHLPSTTLVSIYPEAYQPVLRHNQLLTSSAKPQMPLAPPLKALEAESIYIIREAAAEAENPAMQYTIGKDSSVLLHLARKAFYPAPAPFPLLHVDTCWKFQEMYLFRDFMAKEYGFDLLVHTNPDAIEKDVNPFDLDPVTHTHITETDGLEQALGHSKFDMVLASSRRDGDISQVTDRIFSIYTENHHCDPRSQSPEFWNVFNTRKGSGQTVRVHPLANWTELDLWQYIYQENIPVVPLYFAKPRPVLVQPEMIVMVDDERYRMHLDEDIKIRKVRFRSLGCYPLTSAIESTAESPEDILLELINARQPIRQSHKIDAVSGRRKQKNKPECFF